MGWIKITDLTTGQMSLPKDAVLVRHGQTPPPNHKFAYSTRIPFGSYIDGQVDTPNGADLSGATSEPLDAERHVYVLDTDGDEA